MELLVSYTALPIQPIWPIFVVNRLDWQCCLAGISKMAPRILIFSIAMCANYLFEVKNIEIWTPAFFKHNKSFVATVWMERHEKENISNGLSFHVWKVILPNNCNGSSPEDRFLLTLRKPNSVLATATRHLPIISAYYSRLIAVRHADFHQCHGQRQQGKVYEK